MPKLTFLFLLFVSLSWTSMAPSSTTATEEIQAPPRWEKLGQRKVNYKLDRDEIYVTRREGRFTALRVRTERSGINLHRIVVHYGNGQTQTINVNQSVPPGTNSRVLDLPGRKRVITKVVFWYDTKNFAGRKGRVELWGRH